MKTKMMAVIGALMLMVTPAFAHSDNDIGPNGGRLLELGKNKSVHAEVTLTNGMFHVALLDKNLKPIALTEESLTVTGGSRNNPEKPKVEKKGNEFVFPAMKGDSYVVALQFKERPSAKAVTARFEFEDSVCGSCKKQEWLCACGKKKEK